MRIAFDATARSYDKDGRLHISRSHISKACVNPYYGREIPSASALGLDPDKIYYLLRDPVELEKAAPTFARLPILKKHVPVTAEAPRQDLIVGAIGSDVEFLAPYLDADVSIWDAEAIAGIETDKVREFSCAYRYVPIMSPGEFNGEHFDGIMTQIQGNHLALVESGRAGADVLAADSQIPGDSMKKTKLGKALTVALTAAFPKVTIAQDSDLGKLLAGARASSFGKAERDKAAELIVAMDSAIERDKVLVVMDAISDVDDPKPSKKDNEREEPAGDTEPDDDAAEDEDETEEERKKREKREARDKKAADKRAKDAAECETKRAMDEFRQELKDADEARREVRPVVGDVIAQDKAVDIYGFALDQMKIDHTGVTEVPALRAMFRLAREKQNNTAAPVHVAMDASGAEKQFPAMARFRKG